MNLGKPGDVDKTDAIGAAKQVKETEVVSLLERFKSDPTKTRSEVRLELGITDGKSVNQLISSCSSLSILSFLLFISWGRGRSHFTVFFFFLDFPVTTPPRLTREQYEDYLDEKSIKQDYIVFLGGKPVTTTGGLPWILLLLFEIPK